MGNVCYHFSLSLPTGARSKPDVHTFLKIHNFVVCGWMGWVVIEDRGLTWLLIANVFPSAMAWGMGVHIAAWHNAGEASTLSFVCHITQTKVRSCATRVGWTSWVQKNIAHSLIALNLNILLVGTFDRTTRVWPLSFITTVLARSTMGRPLGNITWLFSHRLVTAPRYALITKEKNTAAFSCRNLLDGLLNVCGMLSADDNSD